MSNPRPATGRQFEIRRGASVARVGQVAAVLREFSVSGRHFTETWDDAWVPPMGCGIVLVPWPNRIKDAKWIYQDKEQLLDITDLSLGHASHGLLRNTAYQAVDERDDAVTLAASVYPQHGYPFTLDTSVTYALDDDGLTVTHRLINVGSGEAPFGVGAHPYVRVGDHPVSDLTITLSGTDYARVDDRLIPVAIEPVDGTPVDLRAGVRLADLDADVALTGFDVNDGRVEHRLEAPDGTALVVWADEDFGWAQVYSPSIFPGPGKPDQRKAVAIEPMTCAVNAFNTGVGLRWLRPGETWSASWGLRPVGF
jgi:aldose 1-epimerase